MKLWKKNGKLIVDENKQPILCDNCPCQEEQYGYIMCSGFYQQPRMINANNYIQGAMSGTWYMYTPNYNGATPYLSYESIYCDVVIDGVYQKFNNQGSVRQGNWGFCPDYLGLQTFHIQKGGYYIIGGAIGWRQVPNKRVWQIDMPYGIDEWETSPYLNNGSSYYITRGCGGNHGIRYNYVDYPPTQYDYKVISGTCGYNNEQKWNEFLGIYNECFLCFQDKTWNPNLLNFVIDKKQFELPLYDQNQNVISPSGICKLEYHASGVTVTSDGWGSGIFGWKIEDNKQIKGAVITKLVPPKQ